MIVAETSTQHMLKVLTDCPRSVLKRLPLPTEVMLYFSAVLTQLIMTLTHEAGVIFFVLLFF